APAEGLTPRYAAPELVAGGPLTVRAEVYALGVTLREIVDKARKLSVERRRELLKVAARATSANGEDRFPSADEFASALRRAGQLPAPEADLEAAPFWPVVGIDATSARLLEAVRKLPPGAVLRVAGPAGSGRSVLLRRLAWSIGIAGQPLAWIEEGVAGDAQAVRAELGQHAGRAGITVLVDDADLLDAEGARSVLAALEQGARLVLVGGDSLASDAQLFEVPPLDAGHALELIRRAAPSLTDSLQRRVLELSAGRPGELRRVLQLLAGEAVASAADLDAVIGARTAPSALPPDPLARASALLDRGRYNDAAAALAEIDEETGPSALAVGVARARLELGQGNAAAALEHLTALEPLAKRGRATREAQVWQLYLGRARIGVADYVAAAETLRELSQRRGAVAEEAAAYYGLALSYGGRHEEAQASLLKARDQASDARVRGIALACLGVALQRSEHMEDAREAYAAAIAAAEDASDASTLATVQLNLACLLKTSGEIAAAIEHFEAAVDMGQRSGRAYTARNALLNLANTDLYLGRLARARAAIERLVEQAAELPPVARAQLLGLRAELGARSGQIDEAESLYDACAAAYDELGRAMDAAEARLEAVLLGVRRPDADLARLRAQAERARAELGDETAHRPLLLLASARLEAAAGDEAAARSLVDEALAAARGSSQREWVWRALEARAELAQAAGQAVSARRDREEALAILESIGARLPRDLREVYWNDPRRRQLRQSVHAFLGMTTTEHSFGAPAPLTVDRLSKTSVISSLTATPLEQRLARILEVNSQLVGELDLVRLTARITDFAVELSRAERGYVLLTEPDGSLSVHTSRSRSGDELHSEFSRSVAETVIRTRQPLVSLHAQDDGRMKGFASVHQLMVKSVACVPILAPSGDAVGALYVETRSRPGSHFEQELPTLGAFADQVAIAIENARLINENKRRAEQLLLANQDLEDAQRRLRELLGDRTLKLKRAREKLRETRGTLYGHFGYHGLVGTSAAMRRVYALIDRVKDTDVPVLVTGESGTGKEMAARAIHVASERSKQRFLGINCGAIPEHLLESELFGSVRGAFTGADRERKGVFREADGGTLLLDEIGEMPQKMQAGLLRVLQERTVRPVGGSREEPVDVRLVFATNRDLQRLVKAGAFREDLYYRIHVVELGLPALRDRLEDLPQLVDHFLGIFAARYKRDRKSLSRAALKRLTAYGWPGNVRQLEHVLLNAWILSERPELEPEDFDLPEEDLPARAPAPLPAPLRATDAPAPSSRPPRAPRTQKPAPRGRSTLSQHRREERDRILQALEASNWNRVKAAEISGIPRRTFYRRLREYGIQ
ncbi:MAG TPA: sigma 54-interacting transcriptional regulator, partial [Polyangiaceae bacterium]|nr:sigma 54-interacting transcriptional regulator [Polyangiaceae bacterium]